MSEDRRDFFQQGSHSPEPHLFKVAIKDILQDESSLLSETPHLTSATSLSLPKKYMPGLLDQAPETLHRIFEEVSARDLASLSLTCRHFNSFVKHDSLLWKLHYLCLFVSRYYVRTSDDCSLN